MKKKNNLDFCHNYMFVDYSNIDPNTKDLYILHISKDGYYDSHSYYCDYSDIIKLYELCKGILENKGGSSYE